MTKIYEVIDIMNLSERLRVDKEIFSGERRSYENTKILKQNWNNGRYKGDNNEIIIKKDWGSIQICTIKIPVILNIRKKYKRMIKNIKIMK